MEQQTKEMPKVTAAKTCEIFNLVETKEGVRIVLGNYLVTNKVFKSTKSAEIYLQKKPYELIINLIGLAIDKTLKDYETSKKNQKGK